MKSIYFQIHELVPPHVFEQRGEKAWELLDDRMILSIDALKKRFPNGTMTINNYYWGGNRKWSGLRTAGFYPSVERYDASYSQHKYGRAFDCVFSDYDINEVREYVKSHPEEFPYLTGIEEGVSWFHGDTRNYEGIKLFNA